MMWARLVQLYAGEAQTLQACSQCLHNGLPAQAQPTAYEHIRPRDLHSPIYLVMQTLLWILEHGLDW